MPFYECVFIARQDISSSQVEGLASQFSKIIEDNGGRVAKTEMWGLRNLAYRIKKNRKGHYALFNLDASTAAIQEMERNMRLNEDVIRYLTTRVNEIEEGPSIVMQSKHSRDERGGRGGRGGFRDDRGGRGGFRGDRDGGHARHGGSPRASEEATADNKTTDKKEGRTDAKPEEQLDAKSEEKPEAEAKKPEERRDAKPEEKPEAEAKKPEERRDAKPEEKPEAEKDEKEAGQ